MIYVSYSSGGGAPSGTAGGALGGTYPNPTVLKAGAGSTTVSAFAETLLDDADAGTSRTTLGLGTAATTASTAYATAAQGATADAALVATAPSVASKVVSKITAVGYTVGTTNANELYGGVIYVTSAATIVIPAVASGGNFTVVTIGAVAVSVDPNNSDLIVRDGTAQADGEKITNLSTAGDVAVFTYYDATGWHASTNGWTNGG